MLRAKFSSCLVLGDGNFSFSASFATLHGIESGSGARMVSTSFDAKDAVLSYQGAPSHLAKLRSRGVEVYHCVDATRLCDHPGISSSLFELIVFNFPHTGGRRNKISENRALLQNFFASAATHLERNGRIVILLCRGQGGTPADGVHLRITGDSWQVVEMAAKSSLILCRVEDFVASDFVGYTRTGFRGRDQPFDTDHGLVHVFTKSSLPLRFGRLRLQKSCLASTGRGASLCEVIGDKLAAVPIAVRGHALARLYGRIVHILLAKGWRSLAKESETPAEACARDFENKFCVFVPCSYEKTLQLCECHPSERVKSRAVVEWVMERAEVIDEKKWFGCGLECMVENIKHGKNLLTHQLVLAMKVQHSCSTYGNLKDTAEVLVDNLLSHHHQVNWDDENLICRVSVDGASEEVGHLISESHAGGVVVASCLLDLDKLVCLVYHIGDCRWLWSRDTRFLEQFVSDSVEFRPVSLYPETHEHHISFWLPSNVQLECDDGVGTWQEEELLALVWAVGGDCVLAVKHISSYCDSQMRRSLTYCITYQSVDQALSWEDTVHCQLRLREVLSDRLGVVMR